MTVKRVLVDESNRETKTLMFPDVGWTDEASLEPPFDFSEALEDAQGYTEQRRLLTEFLERHDPEGEFCRARLRRILNGSNDVFAGIALHELILGLFD